MTTRLYAAKGFAANGVSMVAGEEHTDQFDAQTVKVLVAMGRLVEEPPEAGVEVGVEAGKTTGKNRAVGLPGGLPT